MLAGPRQDIGEQRGIALLEAVVSLGLVAIVFAGLALSMGHMTRSVSLASPSSTPECTGAECSDDGPAVVCECGAVRWRTYP